MTALSSPARAEGNRARRGLLADVAAEVRPFRAEAVAFAYVLTVAAAFDLLTCIGVTR